MEDTPPPLFSSACSFPVVPAGHWSAPGRKEENCVIFLPKLPGATNRGNCPREPAHKMKPNNNYQTTWTPPSNGARNPRVPENGPGDYIFVCQTTCETIAKRRLFVREKLRAQKHKCGNPSETKENHGSPEDAYPRLVARAGCPPALATAWALFWPQAHLPPQKFHKNFSIKL